MQPAQHHQRQYVFSDIHMVVIMCNVIEIAHAVQLFANAAIPAIFNAHDLRKHGAACHAVYYLFLMTFCIQNKKINATDALLLNEIPPGQAGYGDDVLDFIAKA